MKEICGDDGSVPYLDCVGHIILNIFWNSSNSSVKASVKGCISLDVNYTFIHLTSKKKNKINQMNPTVFVLCSKPFPGTSSFIPQNNPISDALVFLPFY